MYLGIDPFSVKRYARVHPLRLAFTGYARAMDRIAGLRHGRNALEEIREPWPPAPDYRRADTAVTPDQMAALLHFAKKAEALPGSIVEIGSYRGVTTSLLAAQTERTVHAVDPFRNYGGAEGDFAIFRENTQDHGNVVHLRDTSGAAAEHWSNGAICFVFVDAVHDYVNTRFDAAVWGERLSPGGYLAMHDVDNADFPGTRRASLEMSKRMRLVCHVNDLVVLQKA